MGSVNDPDMMSSMPKGLTAATGMDALTHAIEGYTTKGAWEMTDMMHFEAIRLIAQNLRLAVANDPKGREGMALGQYIAGMGFSNVGLGIDLRALRHAVRRRLRHAAADLDGIFNKEYTGERLHEVARAMGVEGVDAMSPEEYRTAAIAAVEKLSEDVGIPKTLDKIREEDLDQLAEDALNDACYPGNPREATKEQVKELFRKIMA